MNLAREDVDNGPDEKISKPKIPSLGALQEDLS